jgi:hypothetical protein
MAIEGDRGTPTERGKVGEGECQKSKKGQSTIDKKQRRRRRKRAGSRTKASNQPRKPTKVAEKNEALTMQGPGRQPAHDIRRKREGLDYLIPRRIDRRARHRQDNAPPTYYQPTTTTNGRSFRFGEGIRKRLERREREGKGWTVPGPHATGHRRKQGPSLSEHGSATLRKEDWRWCWLGIGMGNGRRVRWCATVTEGE